MTAISFKITLRTHQRVCAIVINGAMFLADLGYRKGQREGSILSSNDIFTVITGLAHRIACIDDQAGPFSDRLVIEVIMIRYDDAAIELRQHIRGPLKRLFAG